MSLITDALKTAQRERSERLGGPEIASRALEGFFPNPGGRGAPARAHMGAIAAVTTLALVAVAAFVVGFWPQGEDAGVGPASATAASTAHPVVAPAQRTHEEPPAVETRPAAMLEAAPAPPAARPASVAQLGMRQTATPPVGEESLPLVTAAPAAVSAAAPSLRVRLEGAAPESRAESLVSQAFAAQRRDDVAAARGLYEQAFASGARRADAFSNYGALLYSLGEVAVAIDAYQRALRVDRAFVPAWVNLGMALGADGDHRGATAAFQEALRLDPGNTTARLNLALQHMDVGGNAEARRLLAEVVRAAPGIAEAHYALGQLLETEGDRAGAVRSYNLFLQHSAGRMPQHEEQVRRHMAQLSGNPAGRP